VYDITVEGWHNFLANGLVVHNCVGGVWNEVSRRYVDSEPEFWFPEVWRGRPVNAKQGSTGVLDSKQPDMDIDIYTHDIVCKTVQLYSDLLTTGVAPEQARMVLPQNMMTEWYWTGSLMFFCRVCRERLAPGAQAETREVAEQIAEIVAPLFPVAWAALMGSDGE
jgi:thymidylate synthase (FAD)